MDCHLTLVRRPLLTIGWEGEILEWISAREPHRADRVANRVRQINDLFSTRRYKKTDYNRRQRTLYHKRVPTGARKMRPGQETTGPKRMAPEKRVGSRLRAR